MLFQLLQDKLLRDQQKQKVEQPTVSIFEANPGFL